MLLVATRAAAIGYSLMGQHLSPESFLGGVLIGAMVAGVIAGLIAYRKWGMGRNAVEVQLQAAQANETAALIAADQDRAEYERELSTAREGYHRAREDSRKARDAYRLSEIRFAVVRLVSDLQLFICVLGQAQPPAGTVGVF